MVDNPLMVVMTKVPTATTAVEFGIVLSRPTLGSSSGVGGSHRVENPRTIAGIRAKTVKILRVSLDMTNALLG